MIFLFFLLACAPSIQSEDTDTGGSSVSNEPGEATVDATSSTAWTYLDLETSTIVAPATPEDDSSWDLGFRRYHIKLNGGISGTGGMEVVPMPGVAYDTALDEPTEGWTTDQVDGDDENDIEDYALYDWFAYDGETHHVSPAELIYVVRTVEKSLLKVELLGYYDVAGTPGYVHLHWGGLDDTWDPDDTGDTDTDDPGDEIVCSEDEAKVVVTDVAEGVQQAVLDTTSVEESACLGFDAGHATEGWDLAVMKWTFVSSGEVAELPGQDFDALTAAPSEGFVADDGTGAPMADWYDYDPSTHVISPQDKVYVVHTAGGDYYKLQLTSYYPADDADHTQPHHPTFRFAPVEAP